MDQIISYVNIVVYILIWIVTIIIYQRKRRHFDAGSMLLSLFLVYSIASLFLYNNRDDFGLIRFFPFVYLYLMFMLASSPVLKFNSYKIKEIQRPNLFLVRMLSLVFIAATLPSLPSILTNFSLGFKLMLVDMAAAGDIYNETMADSYNSLGDGRISNLRSIVSNCFTNFGVLLLFYNLTLKKQSKFISVGILLSCLTLVIGNIAISQRGPVVDILLNLVITYLAFKKFLPTKTCNLVRRVGVIILTFVFVSILAITIGRFQTWGDGPLVSIYNYAGQQNLSFNKYGLDNGGLRYGDRTFPLFKRMLGFENVPKSFWERRAKYPNLKVNDETFISFVGDFTLDFGPFIAPIIFLVFTLFVLQKTRIRNGGIAFHQLILLHFVMCVCVQGGLKLYSFADGGNLQVILYILLYCVFRFDRDYRIFKNKKIVSLENDFQGIKLLSSNE